jgi:hypothetical protein
MAFACKLNYILLRFLLQNIEVFFANQRDVDAPAPGRKHPIVVGQVGLRCVHCRHAKKAALSARASALAGALHVPFVSLVFFRTVEDAHCHEHGLGFIFVILQNEGEDYSFCIAAYNRAIVE